MSTSLRSLLEDHKVVSVTFKKVDGSTREMLCTIHPELIGIVSYSSNKKISTTQQSVWDLDKQAWRSFRWESVINFKEVDYEAA